MKKILHIIITAFILISSLPLTGVFNLHADSYYSYSCSASQFEVSYINDDGTFAKISCHSSFSDAKKAMKVNKDYVVRYSKSYSPSKIVAMNSGLVYSYPGRRNSSTMYLIQNPKDRNSSLYKTTYVSNHYEMQYIETCGSDIYDISQAGKGYIRVNMNGFEGFTDLEYTDLVPSKFINKNIPIWLGGNNTYENESPFKVVVKQNYFMIEKNGNYYDLVFHYYRAYPKSGINGNESLSYTLNVDNAKNYLDAGMKAGVKYYSSDAINFYSDPAMTKYVTSVYNYYQFLPLRSTTSIPAATFDAFLKSVKGSDTVMKNQADAFIKAQNTYGCNALLVYAMACLESAYGTSGYAKNRNNLFGWSAYDDSPNDASYFSSVQVCVNEQMGRNLNWFMDYTNRRYFGTCVGNKGAGINVNYASDPYWGLKIASIAYAIDKYNNNSNGNLTDHNKYTLGFVKGNYNDVIYSSSIEWDSKIYKNATGSDVLYTGRYGSHYQKDLTVIVLEQDFTNNRYKIQSTNAVTNGSINTDDGLIKYDFNKSVGYINTSDVTLLYGKSFTKPADPRPAPTYKPIISLRDITIDGSTLSLSGIGAIQGIDFTDLNSVKHSVVVKNIKDNETMASYDCISKDSDGFELYDGYNYQYSGFETAIDLSSLNTEGSYYLELMTTYKDSTVSSYLYNVNKNYRSYNLNINDMSYRIRMNDYFNYRFEIDVISLPEQIDITSINKPSLRQSLVSLEDIKISEEGLLEITAHSFIHYLNHDNKENIDYQLYLVDDKDNYHIFDTEVYDDDIDYKKELNYGYDLSNINFRSSINLSDIAEGNYVIYLVMSNKSEDVIYKDICELVNYGFKFEAQQFNEKTYELITSSVRKRIELNVSGGQ